MNPVSVKDLSRDHSLFTKWDFPRISIRWWEANTFAYTPPRTQTSSTLINPSSFTIPVRWDWQSIEIVHVEPLNICSIPISDSFHAGGGGESRQRAVPRVCQGSVSRMCVTPWRCAVHPSPTLALCPILRAQLLCQLLVVMIHNKKIFP